MASCLAITWALPAALLSAEPDPAPAGSAIPVVGGGGADPARPAVAPLSRMDPAAVRSLDYLGLAVAVAREIEGSAPALDAEGLECEIEALAFAVRAAIGSPDSVDHRRTAAALLRQVLQGPAISVLSPERQVRRGEELHIGEILRSRLADPAAAALLVLSVAERLFPPASPHFIPLRPTVVGRGVYLECRDGASWLCYDLRSGGQEISASDLRKACGLPADRPVPEGLDPVRFGSRILCELARLPAREGEKTRSLALLRAALELDPRQTEPNLALGEEALDRGDHAIAGSLIEAALAVDPQLPRAIALRARLRLARGEPAGARSDLEWLAAHAAAAYPDALLQLADTAIASGDEAAAREALARYRSLPGIGAGLARAEQRLRDLDAAPAIALLKGSKDDAGRLRAIHRLRLLRAKGALPALTDLLADPNLRLRHYAWQALREITGADLGPAPQPWREWLARSEQGSAIPGADPGSP